jgi:hypothetical protein
MIIPVNVLFEIYRKAYSQQFGTAQRHNVKELLQRMLEQSDPQAPQGFGATPI